MKPRLFVVALLATGCGGAAPTPEAAVASFSRAVEGHRYEEAYRLMSRSYQDQTSLEEFRLRLESNPSEASSLVSALTESPLVWSREAVIEYNHRDEVRLVLEGDVWRIATPIVDFYAQSTPREALSSFVRAVERDRFDVVVRLMPSSERRGSTAEEMEARLRAAWTGEGHEELDRIVGLLRESLEKPIEVTGNRAAMVYAERFVMRFVKEDGLWKIEDPD